MRILVVEDNVSLLHSIRDILEKNFSVDIASDGEEGIFLARQNIYDAIILDVMLPDIDGFSILKKLRGDKINTPVMFLTARDSIEDRVKGLDLGGDDYLVKPFQAPELEARVRALLRRSGNFTNEQTLKYKGLELRGKEEDILADGQAVKLTIKQYELLEFFINNAGAILTREQIYDRIWGYDSDTTLGVVEVFTHQLRKKLEPFGYDKDIKTVRGIGYKLQKEQES